MDFSEFSVQRATFTDVNFSTSTLSKTNLSDATTSGCSFDAIDLTSSTLSGDFTGATFKNTKLSGLNFGASNFTSATLTSADLTSCDFSSSNLTGADLSKATLKSCIFESSTTIKNTNFTGCRFLKTHIQGLQKLDLSKEITFNGLQYTDMKSFLTDAGWIYVPITSYGSQNIYTYAILDLSNVPITSYPLKNLNFSHSYFLVMDYDRLALQEPPMFSSCDFSNSSFNGVLTPLPNPDFANFPVFKSCTFTNTVFRSDKSGHTYQRGGFTGITKYLDSSNFINTTCQQIIKDDKYICLMKEHCSICISNSQGNEISPIKMKMMFIKQSMQNILKACKEYVNKIMRVFNSKIG